MVLFARRIVLGVLASAATARNAHPAALAVVARRTLFATPQLNLPPAKGSKSTGEKAIRKPARKPAEENTTGDTSPKRGRGRPRKNPVDLQQVKKRVRVPQSLKPPKRAPGPYFLFYSSFLKSQPKGSTLAESQELCKRASEVWKGYSMAEKQPFYDENEVRKAQAKQEREEFFRNTSASDLKQLNEIRKNQGKTKIHLARKPSIPATPFISFSNEFRNSPDGQAIINETAPEKRYTVRAVIAAGNRWRTMSAEEKAPYFEKFKKEKEELAKSAEL